MKYYLSQGTYPKYVDSKKRLELRLIYAWYHLRRSLGHKNYDVFFFKNLENYDVEIVLKELHDGPTGCHHGGETTTHNIIQVGYY